MEKQLPYYYHKAISHTTIFPDGSSETKENEYIRDVTGMVLPRNGRKQTEIEVGRGATKPIRVYKANGKNYIIPGERLVPPEPE